MMKFYLYDVCLSYIIYCLLFYFMTMLTHLFFAGFMVSLSLGEINSISIGQMDLSRKRTRIKMNGGGFFFKFMYLIRHSRIHHSVI